MGKVKWGFLIQKELFINNLGGINLTPFDDDAPSVSIIFNFLFATEENDAVFFS